MNQNLASIRHERSQRDFPHLKLEDDEYVELAFTRARIGLILTWVSTIIMLILIAIIFLFIPKEEAFVNDMGRNFLSIILFAIVAAILIAAFITTIVHRGNRLFITNKHVIQISMLSPIVSSVNIINLVSIEDVSFHQNTIIQHLFKFGTLRLATVGDETTYTFPYSDITPDNLQTITKLISDAKKANHTNSN